MKLAGRKALVTGAASDGIGRAVAAAYAAEGADVAIHHLADPLPAETLVAMARPGRRLAQVQGDFTDPAEARRTVRAAADLLGGVDILVANAGITERVPFVSRGRGLPGRRGQQLHDWRKRRRRRRFQLVALAVTLD